MSEQTSAISAQAALQQLDEIAKAIYINRDPGRIRELMRVANRIGSEHDVQFLADAVFTHLAWAISCVPVRTATECPGVYVIGYPGGVVKIGKTRRFEQRLRALSTASSKQPERNAFFPCGRHSKVETSAHRALSKSRRHGEFFAVDFEVACGAVQAAIASIDGERPAEEQVLVTPKELTKLAVLIGAGVPA